MSTLADIVAQLESGGGVSVSSQPSSMVNPLYGQYAGFVNQYGSGATGIDNYAQQMLGANPNATLGDFYSSYVLGTGNPKAGYNLGDLASMYPSAYSNLINNAGVAPNTPLASLFSTPGSSSATAQPSGGNVLQGFQNFLDNLGNLLLPGGAALGAGRAAAQGVGQGKGIDQILFSSRLIMLIVGLILIAAGVFSFKETRTVITTTAKTAGELAA